MANTKKNMAIEDIRESLDGYPSRIIGKTDLNTSTDKFINAVEDSLVATRTEEGEESLLNLQNETITKTASILSNKTEAPKKEEQKPIANEDESLVFEKKTASKPSKTSSNDYWLAKKLGMTNDELLDWGMIIASTAAIIAGIALIATGFGVPAGITLIFTIGSLGVLGGFADLNKQRKKAKAENKVTGDGSSKSETTEKAARLKNNISFLKNPARKLGMSKGEFIGWGMVAVSAIIIISGIALTASGYGAAAGLPIIFGGIAAAYTSINYLRKQRRVAAEKRAAKNEQETPEVLPLDNNEAGNSLDNIKLQLSTPERIAAKESVPTEEVQYSNPVGNGARASTRAQEGSTRSSTVNFTESSDKNDSADKTSLNSPKNR